MKRTSLWDIKERVVRLMRTVLAKMNWIEEVEADVA